MQLISTVAALTTLLLLGPGLAADEAELKRQFDEQILPFLNSHCLDCHGDQEPEAMLDLARFGSFDSVRGDLNHWAIILKRLAADEMPPQHVNPRPSSSERQAVVDWIAALRRLEAERNAGDPGPVLPRRLSNAEYNYTIRDLTGVDIRPTREFPVDPANEAGFDNSGESLAMSPALLEKYLDAARQVADHMVLLPDGITFAPHPAVTYSDRDKFAVPRVIDFYRRWDIDYADYFFAAWSFRHRAELGTPNDSLAQIAERSGLSKRYLSSVYSIVSADDHTVGPLAELQRRWAALPAPTDTDEAEIRKACVEISDFVVETRTALATRPRNTQVRGVNPSSQPLILWMDRELANTRQRGRLPKQDGTAETESLRDSISLFCKVFPDEFLVSERGRMYLPPRDRNKGRYLSAGFHLMFGYFRDDRPLYDLVLSDEQRQELDRLWDELYFVTRAPHRQFQDFVYFERAEGPLFLASEEFDFARGEDKDLTSPEKLNRLARAYLAKARRKQLRDDYIEQIEWYFSDIEAQLRHVENAQAMAQPRHLDALLKFAERAWRRSLSAGECEDLLSFYRSLRDAEQLSHEDALRDVLASILVSPHFCYRVDVAPPGDATYPLSNDALASRLGYFLWSSLPDGELMNVARNRRLHDRGELLRQVRRMLQDSRVRGLATEFGGNWLEFRRFQQHTGVDRDRFPGFTNELREAMYEEPIRFIEDLIQRDGSALELITASHTWVNADLAAHYGMPHEGDAGEWIRIDDASLYGRGGLLPMAVFMTQSSPGLRTSPVKRGYWVVRRLLGEEIPSPPPDVPDLPGDEAELGKLTLREALAKHRETTSCAACHDRFDSIGLVFEGFGPIGEFRKTDFGGRVIDDRATFPDGTVGVGIDGLKSYLLSKRQDEFVDNLCRKLLAYALGRTLMLSDDLLVDDMKRQLVANEHRFGSLIETIVVSPQFLRQRGREFNIATESNPFKIEHE